MADLPISINETEILLVNQGYVELAPAAEGSLLGLTLIRKR